MKFSFIYNLVLPLWGNVIDISDYTIKKELYSLPNGEKYDGYSKTSVSLSIKWNEVEEKIGSTDSYAYLMVWTMYQVFHEVSEKLFIKNKFQLFPKLVDQNQIEIQYFKNLQEKGWERELSEYINDSIPNAHY